MSTMKTSLVGLFVVVMGAASTGCIGQGSDDAAEPSAAMQRIAAPRETATSALHGSGLRPVVMVDDGERSTVGWYDAAPGTLIFTAKIHAKLACEHCGYALTRPPPPWSAPEEEPDANAVAVEPSLDDLMFQVDRPLVPGEELVLSRVEAVDGDVTEIGTLHLVGDAR
jgi:hypothetical protein